MEISLWWGWPGQLAVDGSSPIALLTSCNYKEFVALWTESKGDWHRGEMSCTNKTFCNVATIQALPLGCWKWSQQGWARRAISGLALGVPYGVEHHRDSEYIAPSPLAGCVDKGSPLQTACGGNLESRRRCGWIHGCMWSLCFESTLRSFAASFAGSPGYLVSILELSRQIWKKMDLEN